MLKRLYWLLTLSGCLLEAADPDWPHIITALAEQPDCLKLERIAGGASNLNYALRVADEAYFLRMAPQHNCRLYADMAIEQQVLAALAPLGVAPRCHHFDASRRMLVAELIAHSDEEVDLRDQDVRQLVLQAYRKIEDSGLTVARQFTPYTMVLQLLDVINQLGCDPLPSPFVELALPHLRRIEAILSQQPRRTICHLDLHHKNILKSDGRIWLVDWEYAMTGHPYLVFASMASIERWDDTEMEQWVIDYDNVATNEALQLLFLHRVAIDIFWSCWNHIQANSSNLDSPFQEWSLLFREAAVQRMLSEKLMQAYLSLEREHFPGGCF